MRYTYIRLFILVITVFCAPSILAQKKDVLIIPGIYFETDFQKADFKDIQFPFEFKKHRATQLNWGIDLLIEKYLTDKLSVYIGGGYFRDKFNFKRPYDHSLLNMGTDSVPIGTSTRNYIYNLAQLPIGITYRILKVRKYDLLLGAENDFNFSFKQVYNGVKPFRGASNTYSPFRYFGNSIIFLAQLSKPLSRASLLRLAPYIRVFNLYKKDPILYEKSNTNDLFAFDAFGLAIRYIFNTKKK